MTQTLAISHSNKIFKKIQQFELDYPMGSYIPSWKIFRVFSKENDLIASAVKATNIWKTSGDLPIVDVGTGDGLVLKNLIKGRGSSVACTIFEPNRNLCNEAKVNLNDVVSLTVLEKDLFSVNLSAHISGSEVILLVHVLYLLDANSLKRLIASIPSGSRLILITDSPQSLFTDCWSLTASKFAERSKSIHTEVRDLQVSNKVMVRKSNFKTLLKNPFKVERHDLQRALLSMITYSEFDTLPTNDKIEVKDIFDKYAVRDLVYCDSTCYELITL